MDDIPRLLGWLKVGLRDQVVGEQRMEIRGESRIELGWTDVGINGLGWRGQREGARHKVEGVAELRAVRLAGKTVTLGQRHHRGIAESVGPREQPIQGVEAPVLLINDDNVLNLVQALVTRLPSSLLGQEAGGKQTEQD